LFHEGRSIDEIKKIVSYFDQKEALLKNILALFAPATPPALFGDYPLVINKLAENEIVSLVKKSIHEERKMCEELGNTELVSIIDSISAYEIIAKPGFKHLPDDIPHHWINEFLGDHFMDQRVSGSIQTMGLFEAFYGLVNNDELVWFLASPLIKTNFNFNYYFQVWKGGGDYRIVKEKVLVAL
jgi:hypothetical protein